MAFKERVFSGVQPTGNLHLGNYLGAITKFVALQERYDCIYCVVDLHAITVWQDPLELPKATREVTAAFIACGIDPKRHIVFNQSQVAEHAELAWIFNCVARMGWLNRMTQFKEKAGKDRENASVGLFVYPNLMAADILVYRATHVPVGEDQKQHLELSRDIAQKFNNDFADSIRAHGHGSVFFPQPEPLIQGPATRVMSLRDGTKKMSKSEPSDYSRINLTDEADAIAQKIRKAKTDPEPLPSEEKGLESRPEADNLVGIFAALKGTSKAEVLREFGGGQFSTFKSALIDLAVAKLGPIGAEMKRLSRDPAYIDSVLADGAQRAQVIAAETMKAVKDIVGFVRRAGFARLPRRQGRPKTTIPSPPVARRRSVCRQRDRSYGRARPLVAPPPGMPPSRHECQAPQLRERPQAQISCGDRRHGRMRSRGVLGRQARRAHQIADRDAAGDRTGRPQSTMARRRRSDEGGSRGSRQQGARQIRGAGKENRAHHAGSRHPRGRNGGRNRQTDRRRCRHRHSRAGRRHRQGRSGSAGVESGQDRRHVSDPRGHRAGTSERRGDRGDVLTTRRALAAGRNWVIRAQALPRAGIACRASYRRRRRFRGPRGEKTPSEAVFHE